MLRCKCLYHLRLKAIVYLSEHIYWCYGSAFVGTSQSEVVSRQWDETSVPVSFPGALPRAFYLVKTFLAFHMHLVCHIPNISTQLPYSRNRVNLFIIYLELLAASTV